MTELPSAGHGSFFRRSRTSHPLPSKSPSSLEDSPIDTQSDTTRPSTTSTATRSESSQSISSVNDPPPTLTRSSTTHPPRTSVFAQLGAAHASTIRTTTVNHKQRSSEGVNNVYAITSPTVDPTLRGRPIRGLSDPQGSRTIPTLRSPNTALSSSGQVGDALNRAVANGHLPALGGSHSPAATYQHIQDLASKRISTLDYLRKAHEGHQYWLTAFQFQKSDLNKMPYFEARKLGRRATNYLLLGVSIPAILDPNSDTAIEYLRAFHALLTEFDSYQSIHSPDGNSTGSLGRGRIPQMFKRATLGSVPKGRRTSGATDPASSSSFQDASDSRSTSGSFNSGFSSSMLSSFPSPDQDLLPGEEYTFLLTPFLPFEPDYFETFATLCDVLIDCYTKIMALINSPETCGPGIGDLFSKADSRVRKILIAGVVQDFEEATKQGIKSELAGVGKVVLGGLLG